MSELHDHEELEGLASGYALLALEPEEHEAFGAHLVACDVCAQRVNEMRSIASAIALSVDSEDPPPELRERILSSVRAETSELKATQALSGRHYKKLWRVFGHPAAVASMMAIFLLAIMGLAFWVFTIQSSLSSSERRVSVSQEALAIMAQADKWWSIESSAAAPNASGTLAFSSGLSEASLIAMNLPPTTQGKRYEAWVVKNGMATRIGNMWPLGKDIWRILPVDMDEFDAVMITLEEDERLTEPGMLVVKISLSND